MVVASWIAFARASVAAPADRAAEKEEERAMNALFFAAKFADAKAALEGAIRSCAGECSKRTQSRLHRDLGVVYVTGFGDANSGRAEFQKARRMDRKVELDPVVVTPEVKAAWDAAGKGGDEGEQVVLEEEPEKPPPKRVVLAKEEEEEGCSSSDDCEARLVCKRGECVKPPPPPREPAVWLALGFVEDVAFVGGSDVCSQKNQISGGYTCVRSSGSQYHGTPLPGEAGKVSAGPRFAATRLTLASYFPLWSRVSTGLRMGYTLLGKGPEPDGGHRFIFFQAELSGAYWLSGKAFSTKNTGTFLELSGGIAEVDGKSQVTVHENTQVPPNANQLDNPPVQKLDAYQKMGSGFAGGGVGAFLPFGSAFGLLADLRFSVFFPSPGATLSLGVSGAFGL
jgi:hypothetical protein